MYVVLTVGTAVGSLEIRAPLPRVYDAEQYRNGDIHHAKTCSFHFRTKVMFSLMLQESNRQLSMASTFNPVNTCG